jgi:hypothetical protein
MAMTSMSPGWTKALAKATETWTKLSISLVGIAVDPGDLCGLSFLPIPVHTLLEWHFAVDDALSKVAGDHCLEFGVWLPFLSIGQRKFPADAVEVLTDLCKGPIEVSLDRIDLVRLDPWKVLTSHPLSG